MDKVYRQEISSKGKLAMLLLPPNTANATAFMHIIEISNIATFPFSEGQVTPAVARLDST